ncbi:MAG: type IX secretion system outer membrane channel protein PorV [Bacteroidales bacterium]|nr:type IX secretion system outer membrane channel protein PorV [Bacteroidales bacterium]
MLIYYRLLKGFAIGVIFLSLPLKVHAQYSTDIINTIHSAVPFLTIAPDSRAGAMGDVGVATSPDINSQHWNPAKYVFMDGDGGASLSYTPWLRSLIPDINLAYLVGYKKFGDKQAVSGSLRYFSLGNIVFTNIYGQNQGQFNPNELALDLGYSRLFSDNFSGAMAFRFIRSDLTGGQYVGDLESKAGISVAADLAFYYTNDIDVGDKDGKLSFGSNISNMGRKIAYTETQDAAFIPTNLRLGGNLDLEIDDYNTFSFSLDFNKLLIPTPPAYLEDSAIIGWGFDPNVSVPVGMIQSFYDAPGGFKEELHEVMIGGGVEYWYREQFAVRGGYFHEHNTKGNRKYFTFGIGLKLNVFEMDFAYLVPIYATNPLANTLRFTLGFDFDTYRRNN